MTLAWSPAATSLTEVGLRENADFLLQDMLQRFGKTPLLRLQRNEIPKWRILNMVNEQMATESIDQRHTVLCMALMGAFLLQHKKASFIAREGAKPKLQALAWQILLCWEQ